MVMSSIILTQGLPAQQQAKFILLIQFILPMFALVLGQVYEPLKSLVDDESYAKAFFWVLLVTVPVQLLFTWEIGCGYLSPTLGLFSVYQYLQYVPVIFVSAYLLCLFGLWHSGQYRIALIFISLAMAVYVSASLSMLAIILFFAGLLLFTAFCFKTKAWKLPLGLLLLALVLSWSYFQYEKDMVRLNFVFLTNPASENIVAVPASSVGTAKVPAPLGSIELASDVKSIASMGSIFPTNLTERFKYWQYYINGIASDPEALLLGLSTPPDRAQYPSAHNYYLDFVYNFGLIALLPTLFLISFTLVQILRNRRAVFESPALVALSFVVLFLVIADNSMKVSFRQPYSGIFTFFLWGMLLTKLSAIESRRLK